MLFKIIVFTLLTLVLLLIVLLGFGIYFYNQSIASPKERQFKIDEDNWLVNQPLKDLFINSYDGLLLHASLLKQKQEMRRFAILVHGYKSNLYNLQQYAMVFNAYGFNLLLPDLRGHGMSEGNYIGFGYHDRLDTLKWINYLIDTYGKGIEIVLFGVSMGGATVLFSSESIPRQVKLIISDCAFVSISSILKYQMKQKYKLPAFPLLYLTSIITKIKAGYGFFNKDITKSVRNCQVPIIFLHGGSDTFVPTDMVFNLYEACQNEKELYIIKEAKHANAFETDHKLYESIIYQAINKYI